MVYLELFYVFAKIGFTSFGGMSMIPLVLEEMTLHGWMSSDEVTNLVAIAEMTPGPLGLNCATFAGNQAAGMLGGLFAVIGVLTPALTLTLLAAVFFEKFHTSRVMGCILRVVKPICVAMILGVMLSLAQEDYFQAGKPVAASIGIGVLSLYLQQKRKWSVPMVILSAAILGVVCFGGLGL